MPTRKRRPQEGGTPEKVIPPLGWLFLACGIALYIFAFQIPWLMGEPFWPVRSIFVKIFSFVVHNC
ncbi:hypothetical protein IMAU30046_01225 [Lactobacillus helveticus]|nr:hypothetical protein [Lactobacillus helveticus]NRO12561.1 hypothetical protein [Lactobacillus helveticus]